MNMTDRDKEMEKVSAMIERDFTLVGSTAIEDKLQDGVPDTIKMVKEAGI